MRWKIHSFKLPQGDTLILIQSKIPSRGILRRLYEPPSASPPSPHCRLRLLLGPVDPPGSCVWGKQIHHHRQGLRASTSSLHLKSLSADASHLAGDLHFLLEPEAPEDFFFQVSSAFRRERSWWIKTLSILSDFLYPAICLLTIIPLRKTMPLDRLIELLVNHREAGTREERDPRWRRLASLMDKCCGVYRNVNYLSGDA